MMTTHKFGLSQVDEAIKSVGGQGAPGGHSRVGDALGVNAQNAASALGGPVERGARQVGLAKASEMILTGAPLATEAAYRTKQNSPRSL
jgi:hypothetical protein